MRVSWILFLMVISLGAVAQKDISTMTGAWFPYLGNHKLSDKFSLHTEVQLRRNDYVSHWQQQLYRIGLDYHLNKQNSVTLGYGFISTFPYGEQPIVVQTAEHRIWQQYITQANFGRFYLHHRYRLEQRFIERASLNAMNEKVVDGFNFRQRVRYRFLVNVPLSRKTMEDNTLFFSTSNEVFLGFGKGIGKNILDQNRFFAGLGWQFTKRHNVQLGYMNQFVVKANGIQMERNHLIQVAWVYSFDFQKKN
jgi:hypothetical protein